MFSVSYCENLILARATSYVVKTTKKAEWFALHTKLGTQVCNVGSRVLAYNNVAYDILCHAGISIIQLSSSYSCLMHHKTLIMDRKLLSSISVLGLV